MKTNPSNSHRISIVLPDEFDKIIKNNEEEAIIKHLISIIEPSYVDNRIFFFSEYTDHSNYHVQEVLDSSVDIITESSMTKLTSKNILFLSASILLHDIGMQLSFIQFKDIILGYYDDIRVTHFDSLTWNEEWVSFQKRAKRYTEVEIKNIFGVNLPSDFTIPFLNIDDIVSDNELNGFERKLIGEFIRINHARLAHEVAIKGLPGQPKGAFYDLSHDERDIIGLIARSHNMNVRDTFSYLKLYDEYIWHSFNGVYIVYLMIVLRIADAIQIQENRASAKKLNFRSLSSPISKQEWETHQSIKSVNTFGNDSESIYINAKPLNSKTFFKCQKLFKSIQQELDLSWAIIGEVYSKIHYLSALGLKYRRITSNIDNVKAFESTVNYMPVRARFETSNELQKLLIAPLYGNNPTYGVRELLQNSVDACRSRKFIESSTINYDPIINISIENTIDNKTVFTITDNGVGMSLDIIIDYFLKTGASYRKSSVWQNAYTDTNGNSKIQRTGRFGIGALAVFLLGSELRLTTRNIDSNYGLTFKTSLDEDQIEIDKATCDIGTKIEIELSDTATQQMFLQYLGHHYNRYNRSVAWNSWYTSDEPKVLIKVPNKWNEELKNMYGEQFCKESDVYIPRFDDQLLDGNHEIYIKGLTKVIWSYLYNDNILICNGFIIPSGYNLYSNSNYDSYLTITNPPALIVYDFEGKFPLSLNRNKTEEDSIPFKTELIGDIFKDLLAYALCIPFKHLYNTRTREFDILNHPALKNCRGFDTHKMQCYKNNRILFTKKGYLFSSYNSLLNSGISKVIEVWITGDFNEISTDLFEDNIGYIFYNGDNLLKEDKHPSDTLINDTYKSAFTRPFKPNEEIMMSRNFEFTRIISKHIKINYEKINDYTFNNYEMQRLKIISECEKWKTIEININNKHDLVADELTDLKIIDNAFSIIGANKIKGISVTSIKSIKKPAIEEDIILNDILDKYLKPNYIIPYSFNKRKDIYNSLFDDFAINIKNHLKKLHEINPTDPGLV